jgi:hypothetical protein
VDHQRNTNIGELLQVKNIVEDIRDYSENWKKNTCSCNAEKYISKFNTAL